MIIKNVQKTNNKGLVRKFYLILVVVVLISSGLMFALQSLFTGPRLSELQRKQDLLSQENQKLKSDLVLLSSLSSISRESHDMGFLKPQKTFYLNSEEVVAKLP